MLAGVSAFALEFYTSYWIPNPWGLRAIHTYGVMHGDIGAHNIIISPGGQRIWIIDFEAGQVLSEEYKDEAIRGEMEDLSCMFEDLRMGKRSQYVF